MNLALSEKNSGDSSEPEASDTSSIYVPKEIYSDSEDSIIVEQINHNPSTSDQTWDVKINSSGKRRKKESLVITPGSKYVSQDGTT